MGSILFGTSSPGGSAESWIDGASVAVACVISSWSTRNGQSWAHRLLKIQICDQDSNLPISGLRMGVREIAHLADFTSLFIGFLWPLWDGRGQTFADKNKGTTVTCKR
ncbi:RDD family protein (plasmid) [Bifidobacterium fermentum]|uniref:RDD family protein n=1 Tax=Bifidobacterium fermentum TaxID=3059035 RepID=A0AB39UFR7_9BIFI